MGGLLLPSPLASGAYSGMGSPESVAPDFWDFLDFYSAAPATCSTKVPTLIRSLSAVVLDFGLSTRSLSTYAGLAYTYHLHVFSVNYLLLSLLLKSRLGISLIDLFYYRPISQSQLHTTTRLYGSNQTSNFVRRCLHWPFKTNADLVRTRKWERLEVLRMSIIALLMDKDSCTYQGVRLASGQELTSPQLILAPSFMIPPTSPPTVEGTNSDNVSPQMPKGRLKMRMGGIQIDNHLHLTPMQVLFRPQRVGEDSVPGYKDLYENELFMTSKEGIWASLQSSDVY